MQNRNDAAESPTNIRYVVVGITAFAAFLMYLDRLCLAQIVSAESFKQEFHFSGDRTAHLVSIFFLAYALGQMPAGWLADRFGARPLMTFFIAIWSACTVLTGCATGFWTLMIARFGCGAVEAGAYPASGGLISRWSPLQTRGWFSGIVAGGGRLGGAVAGGLTVVIIQWIGHWRAAGWVFGGVGLVFAGVFWVLFRERPADHPCCNAAERALIEADLPPEQAAGRKSRRLLLAPLLRSPGMWLMCLYQFMANVGWVFLATLMPTFFKDTKHLSDGQTGLMSSLALLIGMTGMFFGGWWTDAIARRWGLRAGRMIPLVVSRLFGAGAYFMLLRYDSTVACVAAFAVVAITSDLSVPAAWAYTQDVGGSNVAAALAWPNMWGNIGAYLTPIALNWINNHLDTNHNWHESFAFQGCAFVVGSIVALGIKADVKLKTDAEPILGENSK